MKLINKGKALSVTIIITVCVTAATLAIAYKVIPRKVQPAKRAVVPVINEPVQKYDTVLLAKFKKIEAAINIKDKACTYSGVINIIDKADSINSAKNVSFLFCKKDSSCYYKMGNTETLNNRGLYLYIDHGNKKVLVGRQKVISVPDFTSSRNLTNDLASENYTLSGKTTGPLQTLTLLNERHISCKQYAIIFDTTTYKVARIHARMTNFSDPLNKNKEKILDVVFSNWQNSADIDSHIAVDKILVEDGKQLKLTALYKNYELIRIQ